MFEWSGHPGCHIPCSHRALQSVVTNQRLGWAPLWPMRGPGDWVSGLDEFLADWWEHSGMRCYKVRPRVLPLLSSDGCWHWLYKSIRGLHWPPLTNQLLVQVYIWDYSTGHKKQSIVLRMSLTIWLGDQCTVWSKGLLVTLKFIGLLDTWTMGWGLLVTLRIDLKWRVCQ